MLRTLLILAIIVAAGRATEAGVTLEVLKGVGKAIGREAGQEAAEAGGKNVAKSVAKELAKEGSESIAKQTGKALAKSLGNDVARGAAGKVDDLAKGLGSLNAQSARRLQMMSKELEATGKASQVAELIAKGGSGDQIVDFLWRNKGTIVGGTAITTLFMNPDAVIAAGGEMGSAMIDAAGMNLALPLVENAPVTAAVVLVMVPLALISFLAWMALSHRPFGVLIRILSGLRGAFRRKQVETIPSKPINGDQPGLPFSGNRKHPI